MCQGCDGGILTNYHKKSFFWIVSSMAGIIIFFNSISF
jgi:hypothetical protein